MSLDINDPETDQLARALAQTSALSAGDRGEIITRGRARVAVDDRPVDNILGYDHIAISRWLM